jgi:hypothetical protein
MSNAATKQILSLGAGVQSTTVLLMSIHGKLPRLDAAIFADTQWEPQAVYEHLDRIEKVAKEHGIPVYRVSEGNIREKQGSDVKAAMPFFVQSVNGQGMVKRQCTADYKIEPITKQIREIVGLKPRQRGKSVMCRQWFGISVDEAHRMKPSRFPYIENWYPLIEQGMTRRDCLEWMKDHGYPEPPRSACIGCPFRSNEEWRSLTPEEFEDACKFDDGLRPHYRFKDHIFLHRSLKPLREVDFRTDTEKGQTLLWGNECEGLCGN